MKHASDCAVHNAPALPVGACNCQTSIPTSALEWLFGEGPDANGEWFGADEDAAELRLRGRYWWRSKFRQLIGH